MAFKFKDASSSDYPPERKTTLGKAGTIDLERVLTVNQAISSLEALFGHEAPGVTIFGLSMRPSMRSLCLKSCCITAEKTLSDTSAHTSIS